MKPKYCLVAILLLLCSPCLIANESINTSTKQICNANQTLKSALDELKHEGLKLIFSDVLIRPWMQVSSSAIKKLKKKTSIPNLNKILTEFNLSLRAGAGHRWLIVKDKNKPRAYHITGHVKHHIHGRPIDNATIMIEGTEIETRTDSKGCFVLNGIFTKHITLQIDARRFSPASKSISIPENAQLASTTISLQPFTRNDNIEEIIVSASSHQFRLNQLVSSNHVSQEETKNFPRIANDINRVFRHIPGAASGDVSPRIHLRGGLVNETGISLDGVELYDPFYFNRFEGLTGIVNSSLLSGAEVLSGGFTADQGRNMSGKVRLTSQKKFDHQHSVGSNVISSHARTSGHYGNNNSWTLSIRKGSWNYAFNSQSNRQLVKKSPFKDIFIRTQANINDNTNVSLGAIFGKDKYHFQLMQKISLNEIPIDIIDKNNENEDSQHAYWWINAKTQWNSDLSSTHIISSAKRNRFNLRESTFTPNNVQEKNESFSAADIKSGWEYSLTDDTLLRWGIHASYFEEKEKYLRTSQISTSTAAQADILDTNQKTHIIKRGWANSLYFAYRLRLFDKLTTEAGLRWDQQTYVQSGNDRQISPRLNILFSANDRLSLRLAWGTYHQAQGIDKLPIELDIVEYYPAQRNEQTITGLSYTPTPTIKLNAELYYKYYSRISPRFENLLHPNGGLQRFDNVNIKPESAEAYGSEWSIDYDSGNIFDGSLSYTYAEATDTINGKKVDRSWSQRHAINLNMSWQFYQTYFTILWLYRSAWPSTEVLSYEIIFDENAQPQLEATIGERNATRSGSYKRLDLRLSQNVNIAKSKLTLFIQLINAFEDQNPCCNDQIMIRSNGQGYSGEPSLWLNRAVAFGINLDF